MIKPYIDEFTVQDMKEIVPFKQSLDGLEQLSMILINDAQKKVDALTVKKGSVPAPANGAQPGANQFVKVQ